MAGRRYEYFLLAAATSCLLDDKAAGFAAIAAANLANPDGRVMMYEYLKYLEMFLKENQQVPKPITALCTLATLVSQIKELDFKSKRDLMRTFRSADREYHQAWKGFLCGPSRLRPQAPRDESSVKHSLSGWWTECTASPGPAPSATSPAQHQRRGATVGRFYLIETARISLGSGEGFGDDRRRRRDLESQVYLGANDALLPLPSHTTDYFQGGKIYEVK
jgi:hypothetical protein